MEMNIIREDCIKKPQWADLPCELIAAIISYIDCTVESARIARYAPHSEKNLHVRKVFAADPDAQARQFEYVEISRAQFWRKTFGKKWDQVQKKLLKKELYRLEYSKEDSYKDYDHFLRDLNFARKNKIKLGAIQFQHDYEKSYCDFPKIFDGEVDVSKVKEVTLHFSQFDSPKDLSARVTICKQMERIQKKIFENCKEVEIVKSQVFLPPNPLQWPAILCMDFFRMSNVQEIDVSLRIDGENNFATQKVHKSSFQRLIGGFPKLKKATLRMCGCSSDGSDDPYKRRKDDQKVCFHIESETLEELDVYDLRQWTKVTCSCPSLKKYICDGEKDGTGIRPKLSKADWEVSISQQKCGEDGLDVIFPVGNRMIDGFLVHSDCRIIFKDIHYDYGDKFWLMCGKCYPSYQFCVETFDKIRENNETLEEQE